MPPLFDEVLSQLNENQKKAVCTVENAVVTAGAGSGKTTVLAYRYAYLIIKKRFTVDSILTLTFTNKAANEMYERIYKMLLDNSSDVCAKEAVDNFYKANIQTIDSFCTKVARTGSALFGIAPDFKNDDAALSDIIKKTALEFMIDNRENKILQKIAADKKIKTSAENLFADIIINHSPITRPLNFNDMLEKQISIIINDYNILVLDIENILKEKKKAIPKPVCIENIFNDYQDTEKIKQEITAYIDFVHSIRGQKEKYKKLVQITNFIFNIQAIKEIFRLLEKFQKICGNKKRFASILSFNDIAYLAVDVLTLYPDIRRIYKNQIQAIMIDEFQDNNKLQKDMIFLLAENEEQMKTGLPEYKDLSPCKMFFVGDEKQSIYKFRGADVSVFRTFDEEFTKNSVERGQNVHNIILAANYRSRKELIKPFNMIFKYIFSGVSEKYEAKFGMLNAERRSLNTGGKFIHFAFFDSENIPQTKADNLSTYDLEAAFIACKIKKIVHPESNFTVLRKESAEAESPCCYNDIAILMRKKSHQNEIEKQLKSWGIPYNAEEPVSLVDEEFVNDSIAYLRLLLYPKDILSYAAVLRSPFVCLSDLGLSVCMLKYNKTPFENNIINLLSEDDAVKYQKAGEYYRELRAEIENCDLNIALLITKFWYNSGYRFESLVSPYYENKSEIYDFFFELACKADRQGKNPAQFLEYIEDLQKNGFEEGAKKIESLNIPVERGHGVHILTIHKSKGLEFPVVFIYGCGDKEKSQRNAGAYYFTHDDKLNYDLLTLNLPSAEGLKNEKYSNYFFSKYKNEEQKKSTAELKRLLYVAATRAESALFLTGTLPKLTKLEKESVLYDNETDPLIKRLKLYRDKLADKTFSASFLNLIVPAVLAAEEEDEEQSWIIESIPFLSREELRKLAKDYAQIKDKRPADTILIQRIESAKKYYAGACVEEPYVSSVNYMSASKMYDDDIVLWKKRQSPKIIVKNKGYLSAVDFGTIVHNIIEDRFKGVKECPPKKGFLKRAHSMADNFFNSELGKKSLAAPFIKTEYPFVSLIEDGNKKIYISGKIDLLFRNEESLYIIDYKTDKEIEPQRHTAQINVYKKAVCDIFPDEKNIKAYLFYLRSGKEILV